MANNTKVLIVCLALLACITLLVALGRITWEVATAFLVGGLPMILVEIRKSETVKQTEKE